MSSRLRTPLRIATWTTAGMLGLGIAAGAADAVVTHQSTASTTVASAPQAAAAKAKPAKPARPANSAAAAALGKGALLKRLVHGEFTLRTKTGFVDATIQRGAASNITQSPEGLTVTSADTYAASYVVNAATKVRQRGKPITLTDIKPGSQVVIVATKQGTSWVARRIVVLVPKAAKTKPGTSASQSSGA
jgi:hypothetical protein